MVSKSALRWCASPGVFFLSLAQVAHYAQGFGMNVIAFDDPVPEADLKAVGIEKARICPNRSAMSRDAPCVVRGRSLTPRSTPGTQTHTHSESAASLEHCTHTHTRTLRAYGSRIEVRLVSESPCPMSTGTRA